MFAESSEAAQEPVQELIQEPVQKPASGSNEFVMVSNLIPAINPTKQMESKENRMVAASVAGATVTKPTPESPAKHNQPLSNVDNSSDIMQVNMDATFSEVSLDQSNWYKQFCNFANSNVPVPRGRKRRTVSASLSDSDQLLQEEDAESLMERRNARERLRVQQVNRGFEALRERIPVAMMEDYTAKTARGQIRKLSKVDTLRLALEHIKSLEEKLSGNVLPVTPSPEPTTQLIPPNVFLPIKPQRPTAALGKGVADTTDGDQSDAPESVYIVHGKQYMRQEGTNTYSKFGRNESHEEQPGPSNRLNLSQNSAFITQSSAFVPQAGNGDNGGQGKLLSASGTPFSPETMVAYYSEMIEFDPEELKKLDEPDVLLTPGGTTELAFGEQHFIQGEVAIDHNSNSFEINQQADLPQYGNNVKETPIDINAINYSADTQ